MPYMSLYICAVTCSGSWEHKYREARTWTIAHYIFPISLRFHQFSACVCVLMPNPVSYPHRFLYICSKTKIVLCFHTQKQNVIVHATDIAKVVWCCSVRKQAIHIHVCSGIFEPFEEWSMTTWGVSLPTNGKKVMILQFLKQISYLYIEHFILIRISLYCTN